MHVYAFVHDQQFEIDFISVQQQLLFNSLIKWQVCLHIILVEDTVKPD